MAWVYSQGVLEAEEVAGDAMAVIKQLNQAASRELVFFAMEDTAGDPVVFNLPLIVKIKESE